ncbi:hypothetical protein ASPWEDRAFT_33905, partial [Aspergillus wentii DTO 134E9]
MISLISYYHVRLDSESGSESWPSMLSTVWHPHEQQLDAVQPTAARKTAPIKASLEQQIGRSPYFYFIVTLKTLSYRVSVILPPILRCVVGLALFVNSA